MAKDRPSGEERRAAYREAYKAQFRKMKETKEELRRKKLRHQQSEELGKMAEFLESEDSEAWIERLHQKTAFNEAKVDMALENKPASEPEFTTSEEPSKGLSNQTEELSALDYFGNRADRSLADSDATSPSRNESSSSRADSSGSAKSLGSDLGEEISNQSRRNSKSLGGLDFSEEDLAGDANEEDADQNPGNTTPKK
jgi:hypothetical protein